MCFQTGPGCPEPTTSPSRETTGLISLVELVSHISSACRRSCKAQFFFLTGVASVFPRHLQNKGARHTGQNIATERRCHNHTIAHHKDIGGRSFSHPALLINLDAVGGTALTGVVQSHQMAE